VSEARTGGSDTREARGLDDPVMGYDLVREAELLRAEPGYRQFGRSSKTLGKDDHFRLVLTTARTGVDIGNDDAEAAMAITVLEGGIRVDRAGDGLPFGTGSVVWFAGGGGWSVEIIEDAAILLSIGWPGAITGEEQSHD
jgi:hypothetical protein